MKKLEVDQFRQGDVALVPVPSIPKDAVEVKPEGGRLVLMHGEVTGHAHAFYDTRHVQLVQTPKRERFLRVVQTSYLKHEEHTQVEVPPGLYRLPTQTEWTDEMEPRQVAD